MASIWRCGAASAGTDVAGAQEGHGRLVGELLTGHAGYEMAAPDQPACLQPAQRPQDVAPGDRQTLLDVDVSKHDAPAQQQLPGDRLGQLLHVVDRLGGWQERPAALDALSPPAAPASRAGTGTGSLAPGEPCASVQ